MRTLVNVHSNEMDLLKVCTEMEFEGVKLNEPYIFECSVKEQKLIEKAKENFEKDTGRAYKDSSKLFAEIFTERGEKFPLTEKGNPSFKGDFLDLTDTPTAKLINNIRFHEKRYGTYFRNFMYYADNDGFIHPSMNQGGTKTGRFSYSQPNLQNLPKEDDVELDTNIRRSFIPPDGYTALSIDYDQQEFRLLLDYAGELRLIKEINEGADVHQATADLVRIPRKQAKTLNFALLYGVGISKLAKMLKVTESQARDMKTQYFLKLPKVKRFLYEVRKRAERRGYTFNWNGRLYWCRDYRFSYKHCNYIIQGGGADIIKKAMVEIQGLLKPYKTRMVIQVHDELWFYLAPGEEHLVSKIKEVMAGIYKPFNGLRLTVSEASSDKSFSYWDLNEEVRTAV